MKAHLCWNPDHDICVVRFDTPGAVLSQLPTNAINAALKTFYDQSEVSDPFLIQVWSDPNTLWGFMVTETMNLTDEQAFALAQSIVDSSDLSPQLVPYQAQIFEF